MNAQGPRRAIRAAALLAAAILLASCSKPLKPYAFPLGREPAAWIELQYLYDTGVRGGWRCPYCRSMDPGTTTLRVSMFIRDRQEETFRSAYTRSMGLITKTENPKVPIYATRIRPVEGTAIRMTLGFEFETEMPHVVRCSATQQFNPEPDKVYLVNYTTLTGEPLRHPGVPMHCAVAIFLETPRGNGTFTLESVGEPYVE